jgi:Ferritin-like domain
MCTEERHIVEKRLNDLIDKALSRRKFMAGAGTAAAAALVVGCNNNTAAAPPTPPPTPPPLNFPDNDILNFALNLEYLEAEFYLYAATGSGLSSADALTGAGTTIFPTGYTPAAVPWGASNALLSEFANELAQTELDHVRFLQAAITSNSGTPVPRPALDFSFFAPLATTAGITNPNPFNPFTSAPAFLIGAFIFEDVGVTAYAGAAPLIANNNILSAGAGLQAAEAYHAASIRTLIVAADAAASSMTYTTIANQVSALRATLGGGNETALSNMSIVAANASNAVGFARTTDQVLHIVYGTGGTAGVAKGGFFPNGMNGNIKVTAS